MDQIVERDFAAYHALFFFSSFASFEPSLQLWENTRKDTSTPHTRDEGCPTGGQVRKTYLLGLVRSVR